MDESWNVIPIRKNDKRPLIKWEEYKTTKFPNEELSNYRPCNYAVVCGSISNNLVILDLDYKDGNKQNFAQIFSQFYEELPKLAQTFIVETPHGHHFYYSIKGDCPSRSLTQDTDKDSVIKSLQKGRNPYLTKVTNFPDLLKGVDVLGENGYALIPPSKIIDGKYKKLNDLPIRIITPILFNKIKQFFLKQKPERRQMREPFHKIITGEINIEEYSQLTGEKEFVYWKYMFLEAYNQLELLPKDIIPLLEESQPAFEMDTTLTQLNYINLNDKPLTNEKLGKYFPTLTKEKKKKVRPKEDPDYVTIANYLMNKYNLVTMSDTEQLMIRKGNTYTTDLTGFYKDLAEQIETTGKNITYLSSNILKRIKYMTLFDRNKFDYEEWIISFHNGYYDIKTDTFHPTNEANGKLFCYEIPHSYEDGNYDCPKFKKALNEWLGEENKIKPNDMFEMIGYTMIMNTDMKMAFFVFGPSHSGKTQYQTVLENVIGHQNRINIPLQRLCKNEFGTEGAEFKTFDMVGDMGNVSVDDVSVFKEFTGGDKYMRAELKGGKKYQFRNICKIWYNGNEIPALNKDDQAFYNRWILTRFPNVFDMFDKNTVKNLGEKICEDPDEIQGIIHECIKGLKRLYKRQYFRREIMINTAHLWKYYAEPLYAFIYDNCIFDKEGQYDCKSFVEKLNDYLFAKGKRPLTAHKVTSKLETYGIYKTRSGIENEYGQRPYFYLGIRKKEGIEKTAQAEFFD